MRVALLFIDGVGVGARDPDFNPLARRELLLSPFEDGTGTALPNGSRTLLETTFGVPGRPRRLKIVVESVETNVALDAQRFRMPR